MGAPAVRSVPDWKGLFDPVDMAVRQRLNKQAGSLINPVVNERFFLLRGLKALIGSAETGGEKVENIDGIGGDLAIDDQGRYDASRINPHIAG